jgi:hypothetical protein
MKPPSPSDKEVYFQVEYLYSTPEGDIWEFGATSKTYEAASNVFDRLFGLDRVSAVRIIRLEKEVLCLVSKQPA